IVLPRGGRDVVVHEWKSSVGHRFHDDFQGLDNWGKENDCLDELADHGVMPDFEHTAAYQTTAFDAKGRSHLIRSSRPLYYLLRRGRSAGSLDRGLLAQALAEGVEVRFNDRVRHISGPGIIATGPGKADVIASGYIFDTNSGDGSWFSLDQKLAPGGYAYLLIKDGRGTLASCMYADFHNQSRYVDRTRAFFTGKLGFSMSNLRKFGGYGSWSVNMHPVLAGNPVVGERAGAIDALAGFGLRHSMKSGILAAQSILGQRDYVQAWRREILPQLRTGVANRMIFEKVGSRVRGWALRHLAGPGADPLDRLRLLYAAHGLTSLAYPLAALKNRGEYEHRCSATKRCDCVRCKKSRRESLQKSRGPSLAASTFSVNQEIQYRAKPEIPVAIAVTKRAPDRPWNTRPTKVQSATTRSA
ncbi:MAG: NAD(P)/FAD-dependent oxidoreductase, partial [Halocynthiibacter sp.]